MNALRRLITIRVISLLKEVNEMLGPSLRILINYTITEELSCSAMVFPLVAASLTLGATIVMSNLSPFRRTSSSVDLINSLIIFIP